jgi:hypothetical protein
MAPIPSSLYIFVSAELLFLLVRSSEIQVLAKAQSQRTQAEQGRVARGLVRSLVLESVLFVPVSAGLALLTVAPLLSNRVLSAGVPEYACYSFLGLASYGFPFATIRHLVTRIALKTLAEFADIASNNEKR